MSKVTKKVAAEETGGVNSLTLTTKGPEDPPNTECVECVQSTPVVVNKLWTVLEETKQEAEIALERERRKTKHRNEFIHVNSRHDSSDETEAATVKPMDMTLEQRQEALRKNIIGTLTRGYIVTA